MLRSSFIRKMGVKLFPFQRGRVKLLIVALFIALSLSGFVVISNNEQPIQVQSDMQQNCRATLVTAYYKIKSKHSPDEYYEWMSNFLTLQDCMIVYTTEDFASTIRSLRPEGYPLEIKIRPLDSLGVAQELDEEGWAYQESLDAETKIGHSRYLYWIWNEKSAFLYEASKLNPFNSEYFAWLDIGAIKHTRYNYEILMQELPTEKGIILLQIHPFEESELQLIDGICHTDFKKVDRIGGGMIAGDAESIYTWYHKFYAVFRRYVSDGRFAGKDQSVMATTCIENDICLMVEAIGAKTGYKGLQGDMWFYLQDFFLGRTREVPRRINVLSNPVYNSHYSTL